MSRLPFSGAEFNPAANRLMTEINTLRETCSRLRRRIYTQQRKISDLEDQLSELKLTAKGSD